MLATMRKPTLALVAAAAISLPGPQAQAGPFLDWLLGRPVVVYPSPYVAGYPSTPVAVQPVPINPPPQVANYAAAPQYAAPQYAAPQYAAQAAPLAVQPSQPVVVGYAPTYRTNWLRVPLTYYRPVTRYDVAGYPVVAGQPCNTYAWQAQRVPTLLNRPWVPFTAPTNYGYAGAAPAPVNFAPVAPPRVLGAAGMAVPQAATGTPIVPADQAPSLLQNDYPMQPLAPPPADALAPSPPSTDVAPAPIPADAASQRRETNSPYRVAPIPAPDVRKFDSKRGVTPAAPPLINSRERTVANGVGKSTSVGQASWVSEKPHRDRPAPSSEPAAPKSLWSDSGWQTAKSW